MRYLLTDHGTGDAYMTLAFARACEERHGPTTVCLPSRHADLRPMFPDVGVMVDAPPGVPDVMIHPSNTTLGVRIDHLALLGRRLTHADLWRAMLHLPRDARMRRGTQPLIANRDDEAVILIPEARSILNDHPTFWQSLHHRLVERGHHVLVNDPRWSLAELLQRCAWAGWVIGPQCGVMAILCHAMFPCRKTIATPSLDGHEYFRRTYPYMGVETYAGESYADVAEVKIAADHHRAVEEVLSGRPESSAGAPVEYVQTPLSHGDFFDRLSILELKVKKLEPLPAVVLREYLRYREIAEATGLTTHPQFLAAYDLLKIVNEKAWEHNEISVTEMYGEGKNISLHFSEAARYNRQRVELRNAINRMCGSWSFEVKSYYKGE